MNAFLYRLAPTLSYITAAMLALLALALLTVISPAAFAQSSIHTLNSGDEFLELEVNKGVLVRLPQPASAVFVSNPAFADIAVKSPTLVYVMGRRTGVTSLFAVDSRDQVLVDATVKINHNLSDLRRSIQQVLPDTDIQAHSVPGGLLLTGLVNSIVEAESAQRIGMRFLAEEEELINQIGVVGPNQVNLRVRVAEVSRNVLKRLGFNFEIIGALGNFALGAAIGRPIFNDDFTRLTRNAFNDNILRGSYASGSLNIDSVIDALEDEGLVTLLAEPNLTALSGETALFLAGGEFPIPVAADDNQVTIEFKQFGVNLAFTPVVNDAGRITLTVVPEVSSLSSNGAVTVNGINIPALNTRRVDTTVELASGQSFAIAGLLQNNTIQNVNEFPGLADLPILGTLFRSTEFTRNETELVVIVTPYLVRPASAELSVPTDGYEIPDDYDRIVKGDTRRRKQAPAQRTPQTNEFDGSTGPSGFELY